MARKSGRALSSLVESLYDLNTSNVWSMDGYQIAALWKKECSKESFASKEDKLLNVIRSAFEVVHFKNDDPRAKQVYGNGEWTTFSSVSSGSCDIAIRPKQIKRLSDLNVENVKSISAAMVLELIDRNFGGGWDSVPSGTQKVIESCFDVNTIQLPSQRLHTPGGVLERKLKDGFEVLEIAKGTWTEAIFVKKKEIIDYPAEDDDEEEIKNKYRSSVDDIVYEDGDEVLVDEEERRSDEIIDDEFADDDTLFSSFIDEDNIDGDGEDVSDGFIIEEG